MFNQPIGGDKHRASFYGGWTRNFAGRMHYHERGRGSALTRYAVRHGIKWMVVYHAPGTTTDEKAMKSYRNYRKFLRSRGINIPAHAGKGINEMVQGDPVYWLKNSTWRKGSKSWIKATFVRRTMHRVTIYVETSKFCGNLSVPANRVIEREE